MFIHEKKDEVDNENRSVLNTDAFDKRRFNEIYEMSQGLQKISDEGELPTFEPLLADIWASLYKMKPEMTEEDVAEELQVNKSLMEKIMTDESFENYRSFTRLDDLSSAIGTVKFGEKTNQWLAEQKERMKSYKRRCRKSKRCRGNSKSKSSRTGLEMAMSSCKLILHKLWQT